jgi:hypothetical protein
VWRHRVLIRIVNRVISVEQLVSQGESTAKGFLEVEPRNQPCCEGRDHDLDAGRTKRLEDPLTGRSGLGSLHVRSAKAHRAGYKEQLWE